jgi:large subunit ribosomal protein L21
MPQYAVIALSGKQFRVREGERLTVERLSVVAGETISPTVLATGGPDGISDGGRVTVRVEEHVLGPKILVSTYKPKRNQRTRRGHRSRLSRVVVESIGG